MIQPGSAAELRAQARAAHGAQRWDEARSLYERLCATETADAGDWCALGTIHGTRGDMARAESCFRRALGLDPRSVEALCNLGVVHETRGETDAAIERYRTALAVDPDSFDVAQNLASLLCDSGRLDECEAVITLLRAAGAERALEADVLQGRIHERRGEAAAARACFRTALARKPDHVEAGRRLAILLLGQWRCEEALPLFRRLARAQPRDAGILSNLAVTLVRLGRLPAAERACEQALAANPRHAGARENRDRIRDMLWAYDRWYTAYQTLIDRDRAAIRRRIGAFREKPTISLLMPVRDGVRLLPAIESAQRQLYERWELIVALSADTPAEVRALVDERAARDPRIRRLDIAAGASAAESAHAALAVARGEWVARFGEHDEMAEQALYFFVEEMNRSSGAALIYGDEDRIDDERRHFDPWFRPEWNPDLLLSQDYIGGFACCRVAEVRRAGGFDARVDGYHDWNLLLQLTALVAESAIRHVPFVLYHRRVDAAGDEPGAITGDPARAAAMLEAHLAGRGHPVRVTSTPVPAWRASYPVPDPAPLATIIIPTRDRRDLLEPCVRSIFDKTRYPRYELLIVDNQSADPEALDYLRQLSADPRVRVMPYDAEFNYSAICNRAVRAARGEVVVLLNNDTEVISTDWLEELVGHALRPEVGVVGAMLYFPDDTIQHAGVAAMPPGQGWLYHLHAHHPRAYRDSRARARATQNLIAVTGACQALRKSVYEELGGMDADRFVVSFNDVELCLKARAGGYRVVWTPWAELYHRESATTGNRIEREVDRARAGREYELLRKDWAAMLDADPAQSPNIAIGKNTRGLAWPPRVRRPWAERAATRPASPDRYLAVSAIVKNERRYLEEWLRFHEGIGVERFYLYDNGSTDGTLEFLEQQDPGRVTVYRLPGVARQGAAYQHCVTHHRDDSRWIAFIDADEFIVPSGDLRELLAGYEQYPALCAHWYLFGSSGQLHHDPRPVVERFTRREAAVNPHVKSIVDPRRTLQFVTAHKFAHAGNAVDENRQPVGHYDSLPGNGTCSRIQINHYVTKSRAECLERRRRPAVDTGGAVEDPERYFAQNDRNEVEDLRALEIWRTIRPG